MHSKLTQILQGNTLKWDVELFQGGVIKTRTKSISEAAALDSTNIRSPYTGWIGQLDILSHFWPPMQLLDGPNGPTFMLLPTDTVLRKALVLSFGQNDRIHG